jgi:hypothetical protein
MGVCEVNQKGSRPWRRHSQSNVDLTATPPTVTETGAQPSAEIVITDSGGKRIGATVAGADGSWSVELPKGIDPKTSVQVVQVVNGMDSLPTEFALADAPVIDDVVAASVVAGAVSGSLRLRSIAAGVAAS